MTTREEWLQSAVALLREGLFKTHGFDVPEVYVSVGFPGGGSSKGVVGECWNGTQSADGTGHIFISPIVSDTLQVLGILVHKLVHAINHKNGENGHGKVFSAIARPLGLTGKMTATVAGPELTAYLTGYIASVLGEFPHAALVRSAAASKKRSGRYLKLVCANGNDFEVRMSAARLNVYGAPKCPCCDEPMEA